MLLTDDQIAPRHAARRFACEKRKPHYQRREPNQEFDRTQMERIGALAAEDKL